MTAEGTKWTLYINGNKVQEKTSSISSVILDGGIYIGEKAGYYNDFRIYSYVLSPQEIKEISRGLVEHWLGNDPWVLRSKCQNIIWNQFIDGNNYNFNCNGSSSGSATKIANGYRWTVGSTSGTSVYFTGYTGTWIVDYKYLVSCMITSSKDLNCTMNVAINSSNSSTAIINSLVKKDIPKVLSGVMTYKAQYYGTPMYFGASIAGGTINFQNYMILDLTRMFGSGKEPTVEEFHMMFGYGYYPYDPGTTKSFQAFLSDISGSHSDLGITGDVILTTDTPRYDKAIIGGTPSSQATLSCSDFNFQDGLMTLSLWCKPVNPATEEKSKLEILFGKFQYFTYLNYPYFLHGTEYKYKYINYWNDGNWHHLICHYDGNICKIYIDGTEISDIQTSSGNVNNTTKFTIYSRGYYLSDIRVYATALDQTAINELYILKH